MLTPRTGGASPDPADGYELSVDTGGTFTDGFVRSRDRSVQVKVDTTPADLTEGFLACVAAASEAVNESLEGFCARARTVHFSSTVATNIVLQRTGALVGLLVTAGNEEHLYTDTRDAARLHGFIKEEAVRGVDEEIGPDGALVRPVDRAGLESAVRQLLEQGVEIIVVSFARSHLNPANEVEAKALIEASYPKHYLGAIPLLLSSQLSLHANDRGRTALAVANAYLHPALSRSLYKAADRLRDEGFRYPLLMVNTDGSSTRVAKTRAIDTFNSGPSAGVLGSAIVAKALGAAHVVTFDVGGTTTDVAYVEAGMPRLSDMTGFGDLGVPHPAIELSSFGLGGGSIIEVAPDGALVVGPQSVGAVPGPACYGLGGDRLTPTDVWLALGYLEAADFLSGQRQLDKDRATAAIARIAELLGVSLDQAALLALDAIHGSLADHLRSWACTQPALSSSSPTDRWLYSYGGGGGLLAVPAATALEIDRVVVFPQSSTFSAFGGGLLPIAHRHHAAVRDVTDVDMINAALVRTVDRATRDMRAEGVAGETELPSTATLRDFGERARTIAASLGRLGDEGAAGRLALSEPRSPGQLSLEVRASRQPDLRVVGSAPGCPDEVFRRVQLGDGPEEIPVGTGLGRPGAPQLEGPTFLAAEDTTIFIPAGWTVDFDSLGYGIARRKR